MIKKGGANSYTLKKNDLAKLILQRKTLDIISQELNISIATAKRWKDKLFKTEGIINSDRKEELSKEFIFKTIRELEIAKISSLKGIADQDPKVRKMSVDSLLATIKQAMDFYARYGIIPEKLSIDVHNETYNIHKELTINQVLEVLDKEEEEKKKKMEVME